MPPGLGLPAKAGSQALPGKNKRMLHETVRVMLGLLVLQQI